MTRICVMIFPIILSTLTTAHRVVESVEEDSPNPNTTTLYPVGNHTQKASSSSTSWKIDSSYTEGGGDAVSKEEANSTDSEQFALQKESTQNSSTEFRPSIEFIPADGSDVTPTSDTGYHPVKKPPTGFFSSLKDPFKPHKFSKNLLKHYQGFPYKLEDAILTKTTDDWKPNLMETKPTVEAPVRLPAGDLYKFPDAFKEKPGTDGGSDDFGLEFSGDGKDAIKKRVNPWKKILHLLTALLPVGLIFSALTPSVITLTPAHDNQLPPHGVFRRRADFFEVPVTPSTTTASLIPEPSGSTEPLRPPPTISERCRRRLLCELQNDVNYNPSAPRRPCHRLRCEAPATLAAALRWLIHSHSDNT